MAAFVVANAASTLRDEFEIEFDDVLRTLNALSMLEDEFERLSELV
jgi:hypothetical protein